MNQRITFVLPSRNNLEFLKLAYKSIKDLKTAHEILVLDDASIDGTQDWIKSLKDDNLITYHNPGPERIGIVGMFDKGIEMASSDIIFAFHADMIASPNLDSNVLKHLKPKTVVCATRVEPSLHPRGPEKITCDWGIEAEDINYHIVSMELLKLENLHLNKTTEGIFAPWCMYKSDFFAVGGHDELFAPQSKEDSDLFNRFVLNGYKLIQSWDALVYHFTSRGSRFNKYAGGAAGKNSEEWLYTTNKNSRNFIRKWGHSVTHDPLMKPIIPHKYNIGLVVKNCTPDLLFHLEPWCDNIYCDIDSTGYITTEKNNTIYDLTNRVKNINEVANNDVVIKFDGRKLNNTNYQVITQLSSILADSGGIGDFEYDIFNFHITKMDTYEHQLINSKK